MNTTVPLQKYARLIVRVGANVRPGQRVRLNIDVDQRPLAEAIVEECYLAGAKDVELLWDCDGIDRLHYRYAAPEVLGEVLPWEEERAKQMVADLPVRIFVESADPDALNGIPADVLSSVRQMRSRVLKKYRDQIDGRHQWVIAAAASPAWAKKVFPALEEETALQKLWDAILSCVYFDQGDDPVAVWQAHNADLDRKAGWLNKQQFTEIVYHSANGTDFRASLIPGARWCAAGDVNPLNGAFYVPNMPTEEIFTSPMRGKCEGRLVATKPLSWSGQLIEDFTVEFKDGRVSGCSAKSGDAILKKMFAMDEGAGMLGELSFVPKESPINQSGILFYNTLFDENACCHVAVGEGFAEVLDGFLSLTKEEQTARGINDSMIHTDFMIGSDDLSIVGIRADGTAVPIFENGTWSASVRKDTL